MKTKTKHYIEYFYPGILFSETSAEEVDTRDVVIKNLPKSCFGYRYYSIESVKTERGDILEGKKSNISPSYFSGIKYSLEQIKSFFPKEKILISNMENNKIENVVKTKFGQFIPLQKRDIVI